MKAIVQHRYGSPTDVLRLADVDDPGVGADEVLLRVEAAGVNAADWHLVAGLPFVMRSTMGLRHPREPVPGLDVAGRVEAVGPGVTGLAPGVEVFGWCTGAFAQLVRVPADQLLPRPAGLTAVEAAAVPLAAMTALQGLRLGGLRSGHQVLVTGASGGVGTFAVQIAKAEGAHVTGIARTSNLELVQSIGADEAVDYTREAVPPAGERYDLVFHLAGRIPLGTLRHGLTPTGVLVLSTGDGGPWAGPLPMLARAGVEAKLGRTSTRILVARATRNSLTEVAGLLASGAVKPVLDRTYTLAEAPAAVRYVQEGHTRGKVVITV